MTFTVATVKATGPGLIVPQIDYSAVEWMRFNNQDNRFSPAQAYQSLYRHSDSEILIYAHDDLTIHDPLWLAKLTLLFDHPEIGVVGFGGATRLGSPDLYRRPYDLTSMARSGYRSNQTDAETHGLRETGSCRAAVVDAYLMAIRRKLLDRAGGWPTDHLAHHCLDLWVCCEAARQHYEVWMTGVSCTHHGGGTSVGASYQSARWLQGGTVEEDHRRPHRWLYDAYADVLPISTEESQ